MRRIGDDANASKMTQETRPLELKLGLKLGLRLRLRLRLEVEVHKGLKA